MYMYLAASDLTQGETITFQHLQQDHSMAQMNQTAHHPALPPETHKETNNRLNKALEKMKWHVQWKQRASFIDTQLVRPGILARCKPQKGK